MYQIFVPKTYIAINADDTKNDKMLVIMDILGNSKLH